MDSIQNPVTSLSQSVPIPTGQLLDPYRTRILRQASNPIDHPTAVRRGSNGFEFIPRGSLDADAITCHAASDI